MIALLAGPVAAEDFSAGSEATSWGLFGETPARFEAVATDAVCALTGDCPADCGAGMRQMVLVRAADGVTVLATKNGQPAFSGAAVDLAPWCGQRVEVDGNLIGDPEITPGLGAQVYQVQRIRALGIADWTPANRFTTDWAERNPDAAGEGPWFRRDPRILAEIGRTGHFGLGPEVDAAWIAENF